MAPVISADTVGRNGRCPRLLLCGLGLAAASCVISQPGADTGQSAEEGDADVDLDGADYTQFSGEEVFKYGTTTDPDEYDCELVWVTWGSPAERCADCLFVFDVELSYDAARSSDKEGDCASYAADASWTYAYIPDYLGYSVLATGYGQSFYAWALASFDADEGELTYATGYDGYDLSSYGLPGYYYSFRYEGYAEVRP